MIKYFSPLFTCAERVDRDENKFHDNYDDGYWDADY
jgi:hypothetical protein